MAVQKVIHVLWLLESALPDAARDIMGLGVFRTALSFVLTTSAQTEMGTVFPVTLATRERTVTQVQRSQKINCMHNLRTF